MNRTVSIMSLLMFGLLLGLAPGQAQAQLPSQAQVKEMDGEIKASIRKAQKYLFQAWDAKQGTWEHPGITGLVLLALLRSPDGYDDDPFIIKPIEYLLSIQKKNGGIYVDMVPNYITSISLIALVHARDKVKDAKLKQRIVGAIERARNFMVKLQADEGEGYTPRDRLYGGVGYGGDLRPDLSNTQLALEAVRKAGLSSDDKFFKKAMKFLDRCQNRSESNDQKWAGNDKGFVYYPGKTYAGTFKKADGGEGLRSYGSMTYAGLKSFIHAGLKQDDPRVIGAFEWIQSHYTVKENPEVGNLGLFYYYHTFAKALSVYGVDQVRDKTGRKHDWRYDLAKELISRQAADGTWRNKNKRWMEGNPVLATTYAILSLEYCYRSYKKSKPAPKQKPADKPGK